LPRVYASIQGRLKSKPIFSDVKKSRDFAMRIGQPSHLKKSKHFKKKRLN